MKDKIFAILKPNKFKLIVFITCLALPVYSWLFWLGWYINKKYPLYKKVILLTLILALPLTLPFWLGYKMKEVVMR